MSNITNQLNKLFFEQNDLNENKVKKIIKNTLHGMDDGDLFFESSFSESLSIVDGVVNKTSFDGDVGFGFRGIVGESTSFASSNVLNLHSILNASGVVASLKSDSESKMAKSIITKPHSLYAPFNPINEVPYQDKINFLQKIDSYLRAKDPSVKQVSANMSSNWQAVKIMRIDSEAGDIRPLSRINVSVQLEKNGKMESGSFGYGGRYSIAKMMEEKAWKKAADEAFRSAEINLEARDAPSGQLPVVLGPGWTGVLLHEAVGHGLEGDFNRKKTSVFSNRVGQKVASKGVTIIDDGTINERRGSLNVDDEAVATRRNVLIEDGILKGYMQDRLNARLMNVAPTGNGRRESYASLPMPRMTNTFMLSGNHSQQEMIESVKKGIFAANFSGGQVDITSGDFVFTASEAYFVEDGKVKYPIKGVTLSGNGPKVMEKISMIGNDDKLDDGIGSCGKNGQTVPVGVGMPSLLVGGIVVGGTS